MTGCFPLSGLQAIILSISGPRQDSLNNRISAVQASKPRLGRSNMPFSSQRPLPAVLSPLDWG